MRFLALCLLLLFAPKVHAQFVALPDDLVPLYHQNIKARFLPGKNEYTIQFKIDLPKMKLPKEGIEVHSWSLKTPIANLNGNTLNAFDRFFQSGSGANLKDRQTYVFYNQHYRIYRITHEHPHDGSTFEIAPIAETIAAVHQNNAQHRLDMHNEVMPMNFGNEWSYRINKDGTKMIISWRVSTGVGLTMQNLNIENYYPTANTGFLLTF